MTPALRPSPGHLAENVVHFARVLRTAGMPLGTDRVVLAQQALQVAGLERREDFHAVLRACLLDRIEHAELFDQAFALFWKDPDLLGRMRALLLPKVQLQPGAVPGPPTRRRFCPVSASKTTRLSTSLADANSQWRPSGARQVATESMLSAGLGVVV